MPARLAEFREFLRIATEALGRYRLRTTLSVLGVVFGVAAVIAVTSVSDGAARESLAQVDALGLNNLIARNVGVAGSGRGLTARDADRAQTLVPFVHATSPLLARTLTITHEGRSGVAPVLGIRHTYRDILGLTVDQGRFTTPLDEHQSARVSVLGAELARDLFGYQVALGQSIRVGQDNYTVVGVLRERSAAARPGSSMASHDLNRAVFVPFPTLSGRSVEPGSPQPADEVWLQVDAGEQVIGLGQVLARALSASHGNDEFNVIVPRALLAQRYRTQRTFSIVVGSVAAIALLVGGIGVMNIMLTSVVERTREIGIRRTVGASRRDILAQFMIETLLMTMVGGTLGIVVGVAVSWAINRFAGWATLVSPSAIGLGFGVSVFVGTVFGIYPATKAAALEPIDAVRYE